MGTNLEQDATGAPGSASPALSPMEIDAIGEVLNISMGSAATAVSTMLDKQVVITTPSVAIESLGDVDNERLEPAVIVKITYTEGITGSNVMVFRQRDLQFILNGLMGIDEPPSDDFVFDELSMSAACEVMNQMMGASATALSDFLGMPVNISTPTAKVMDDENTFLNAVGLDADEQIVSILFHLSIKDVMNSEFVSVLTTDLAKMIVGKFMQNNGMGDDMSVMDTVPVAPPEAVPAAAQPAAPAAAPAVPQMPAAQPAAAPQMPQQQMAAPQMQQPMAAPQMQQQMPQQQMGMPGQMPAQGMMMPQQQMPGQMPMDPAMMAQYYPYPPQMPGYPPYGYMPYPMDGMGSPTMNVKNVQFPEFSARSSAGDSVMGGNMDLIMNVPLQVSIEIGSTRRKIKDIMGFTQGTVLELDKQAGAPVDIVVNGELIAHGDVVVIDDNFGVRITEIVGTKELLSALEDKGK